MTTRTVSLLTGAAAAALLLTVSSPAQNVAVSAGGPYSASVGEPIIFRGAVTGGAGDAAHAWDLVGNDATFETPGQYPMASYDAAGTYTITFKATFDPTPYTDATTVTITEDPKPICVPWQFAGATEIPHTVIAETQTRLKAVVYGKSGGTGNPLQVMWNFGDGTTSAWTNISTATGFVRVDAVEIAHTYGALPNGVQSKPFTATLTVRDSEGRTASDHYQIRVYGTPTDALRANVAIDEGLWYLHKTQTRSGGDMGRWTGSVAGHNAKGSQTASALQAMVINGHLLLGDPGQDPYVYDVRIGFDGLMGCLTTRAISAEPAGNPDTLANGIGLQCTISGRPVYEGGQIMDAICATQLPNYRIYAGSAGVTYGRTLQDIVQDMVDMYAWGQDDSGSDKGGWRYNWDSDSDNSAAQWAAIGMHAAEGVFGCTVPAFVKTENESWLDYSFHYNNRRYGYTYSGNAAWSYFNTTVSAMVQLAFCNIGTSDARWSRAEAYVADNWGSFNSNSNKAYYGTYALVKAMRLARPAPVVTFASNGLDWYADPNTGVRQRLLNDQNADGSWYSSDSSTMHYKLSTAWCIIMLNQALFELVPVAEAGPNITWGKNQPYVLDAAFSYHLDPARTLVKYEWILDAPAAYDSEDFHFIGTRRQAGPDIVYDWDFDGDQVIDMTTETPAVEHTWVLPQLDENQDYVPYTVSLRVTDDNTPVQVDLDTFDILVLDVKPPQSEPGGPYTAYEGIPVQLDGSRSSEWDPGDSITQYDWELTGDSTIDKSGAAETAAVFDWSFNTPGTLTIGLTVYDNGVGLPPGERLSHTAYTTVQVLPNAAPTADAGGPYTVAEGDSVQLSAQASTDPDGHALTYTWDLDNDGQFDDGTGETIGFSVNDHGTYTVSVRASDGGKTDDDSAQVTVTDKVPNVAFHATPSAPYEGQTVQFTSTSTSSPDALASWDWDFDVAGGATSDSSNAAPTHIYPENGSYTVELTVKDDDDVTGASLQQQITVRDTEPNPNFTFSPLTPVLVTRRNGGVQVTFTDTSTAGQDPIVQRAWAFSEGGTDNGAQVTHAYTATGTYYVTLTVQDDDGFPRSTTKQVTVTAPADLVVSNVSATPLPLVQGRQTEFSATVTNQGTGDVVVPFLVDFSIYGESIGTVQVISLAKDASRTVTKYWTTAPGTGNPDLTVTADSADVVTEENTQGTAEANNGSTLALAPFSLPDLELENPGVDPATPVQGDVVKLQALLKNTGVGDTMSPIKVDFHLDGTKVGSTIYSQGLAAGSRASIQIELPWIALAGGQKPLRVVVDPENTVPEEAGDGETNNEAHGTVPGIAYPDLTVTGITWQPATLKQGQAATFFVTVRNTGAATELDIPVQVKVGATVVGTPHAYAGLAAGESKTISTIWVASYGTNLQVTATADPGNPGAVPETQENDGTGNDNNVHTEALGDIALPDLVVHEIKTIPSTGLAQGMVIELLATVKNIGQATAPAATDTVFKIDDTAIGNKPVGRVLQANGQVVLALPWTVTAGTHTFQAVVDPAGNVTEAQEDNNAAQALTINGGNEVGLPDLTVSDLVWDKPTPTQGETVNLTAKVWNIGARTTLPVLVTFDVDGHTVATKTFHTGLESMNPANPGEARTVQATWTAESGAAPRISVHVDHPLSLVPETNENNNLLSRDFGVVAAPDLVVDTITANPAAPDQGDAVTLTATVRNAGPGATTQAIPVRFSVDGGLLVNRTIAGGLAAGASDTVTATWTARAGDHTVEATVNPQATIAESSTANNSASRVVGVGYPQLDIDGNSVAWSANVRGAGAPLTLTLDVENTGQGETLNGFNVTLYEDGQPTYTARVSDLMAAGAKQTVNLIWIARSGVQSLTVLDDSGDEVTESDEVQRRGTGRGLEFTIPTIPTVTPAPTVSFSGPFPPVSAPATPYSGAQTVAWTGQAGQTGVPIELVSIYAARNGGRYLVYSEGYSTDSINGSHSWQTSQLAGGAPFTDGTTQLIARIEDVNGGFAEAVSATFMVDNTPQARLQSNAGRRSALIDETRTYQFTIENGQQAAATYDLVVSAPGSLTTQLSQSSVPVAAWATATFSLTASSSAAGSAEITVTATENLQTRNDPLVATAKVQLDTKEPVEVSLSPATPQTVAMGGSVPCQLTIVNNQRTSDTFSVSAGGIPAAWVSGLPSSLQLAAGARVTRSFNLVGLDANGTFTVTVTTLSSNLGTTYPRAFQVQTNPDPNIANLRPANNTRFGARDVTISWTTVVDATTELYYRSEAWTGSRAETYETVTGTRGTKHVIRLTELERNRKYFFYVRSVSDYGSARFPVSGESAFIVDNGVVFTNNTYNVTVGRDYGGEASISVRNTDSAPHEVYLTVSNIPEELAVGFVGAGHDTKLIVAPGASHSVKLGIFTQDAQSQNYEFDLHLETDPDLPDPIVDDAALNLTVNFPVTDFAMEVIGSDAATLGKHVRLTNNGDPVTDFRVSPDQDLFGNVRISPNVTHGYLKSGESLTFWVYPKLSNGFQYLAGYINAFGAGDSATLFLEFATPNGQQYFEAQVSNSLPAAPSTTPTTNLIAKALEVTDTKRVVKFHLPGTEETDYVIYTIEDTAVPDPDPGNPQALYIDPADWFASTGTGGNVNMIYRATLPVQTSPRGRASGFVKRAYSVVSQGTDTARELNDYYNQADGWIEKVNESIDWGESVDGNTGIPDDLKGPVKLFHDFLNVGGDLVGDVPLVGSLLAPLFQGATETFKNGVDLFSGHNRDLDRILAILEGKATGRDWYCTNRPRVSSTCTLPSWINPQYVKGAVVGLRIKPNLYGTQVKPHNLSLLVNGVSAGLLQNAVHTGFFAFKIDPGILNYAAGQGSTANSITVNSFGFNPGHYASAYDFFISVSLTDATIPIIAEPGAVGDVAWQWTEDHRYRPDFSVYTEDISYGPATTRRDTSSKLRVRLNNEGWVPDVTLVTVKVDGSVVSRFWAFLSGYSRNEFAVEGWSPSGGNQTVTCELWARANEVRSDNNSASRTFTFPNSTTDTNGPLVSQLFPADGVTVDNAYTRVSAAYADASGIDTDSVSLTIDATDVTGSATVTAGQILFEPSLAFASGTRNVVLQVDDQAGNRTTRAWSFNVDTRVPVLANLEATHVTDSGAIIVWETNLTSDSMVRYGPAPNLLANVKFDEADVTAHEIRLGSLTPATTYYFEAFSTRAGGHQGHSGVHTFFTGANNPPAAPSAPSPADGDTDVARGPLLSWTCTDPDAADSLQYDLTVGTDPDLTGPGVTTVDQLNVAEWQAEGLAFDTQYYWRVVATDNRGGQTVGGIWGFRTAANTGGLPEITNVVITPPVVTRPAAGSGATVNVTVRFTASRPLFDRRARWGARELATPTETSRNERNATTYETTYGVTEQSETGEQPVVVGGNDDGNNAVSDSSATLAIEAQAAPPAASFTYTATTPRGLTVAFQDTSTEATSWAWAFDTTPVRAASATDQHPVYTYPAADEYLVRLTAANNSGSDAAETVIDLLGPSLSITSESLTNNAAPTLSGATAATGTVAGSTDPSTVSVTIDAVTYDQGTSPPVILDTNAGVWSLDLGGRSALSDGAHGLTVIAADSLGNTTQATGTLTVDTVDPAVTYVAPTPLTNNNTPTFTGTATDALSGIDQVDVEVFAVSLRQAADVSGTATLTGDTWAFDVANPLSDGEYRIEVAATDHATNQGTTVGSVTIDATKPQLSVSSAVTNDNTPRLSGAASDALSGVSEVTVSVSVAGTRDPVVSGPATYNSGAGSWSYDVTQTLTDGVYTISAAATDQATNTETVQGSLTVDTTKPALTVPTTTFINDSTPSFTGTVSDSLSGVTGVTVSVYAADRSRRAGASGPAQVDGTGNWSFDVTTTLTDGEYTVQVDATDAAGNVQQQQANTTLDATAPSLTMALPATTIRQPTLSGSAADNLSGVSSVSVTLSVPGGADVFTNEPATLTRGDWALPYPPAATELDYGQYSVSVVVADQATNNTNQTAELRVTPDCELIAVGDDAPGDQNKATALSDSEIVVGTYRDGVLRGAFLWAAGTAAPLPQPAQGAVYVSAQAVDDSGRIVGYAVSAGGADGVGWTGAVAPPTTLLESANWGGGTALLLDLASVGRETRAVGVVSDGNGVMHAVSVRADQVSVPTELAGLLNGYATYAYAANDNGQIVGRAKDENGVWRAVRWGSSAAIPSSLDTLDSLESVARDVNAAGTVVGYRLDADSAMRPWTWSGNAMADLPTLGGRNAAALAINDQGLIVGWSETAQGTSHAVLWKDGRVADLNDMVPNAGELGTDVVLLTKAVDINAAMGIIGQAQFKGDQRGVEERAYLLRPVDSSRPGENLLPVTRITEPSEGLRVRLGDTIAVAADVIDLDGTLASVTASAKQGNSVEQLLPQPGGERSSRNGDHSWTWTPAVAGAYTLLVEALDDEGAAAEDEIAVEVVAGDAVSFDINLRIGWNFIAVPFTPVDPRALLAVLSSAWEHTGPGSAYQLADTIKPKVAYWVWSQTARTVSFAGYPVADVTRHVVEGWSAIGSVNNAAGPFQLILQAGSGRDAAQMRMYGWNAVNSSYFLVPSAGATAGQGYWFTADQAGTLTVGPENDAQ